MHPKGGELYQIVKLWWGKFTAEDAEGAEKRDKLGCKYVILDSCQTGLGYGLIGKCVRLLPNKGVGFQVSGIGC
jgi:hypothetical protein